MVYSKDGKIRLKVPCLICPNGHSYTVGRNIFFGRDVFVLPCPVSDINICFMGRVDHVKFELSRTELELLQILEENGVDSFSALHGEEEEVLSDPQIAEIVRFVIHDLEAENKIYCKCADHDGEYDCTLMEEGILVFCKKCGASRIIPVDSMLGAQAFLDCDSLYLE